MPPTTDLLAPSQTAFSCLFNTALEVVFHLANARPRIAEGLPLGLSLQIAGVGLQRVSPK